MVISVKIKEETIMQSLSIWTETKTDGDTLKIKKKRSEALW